jgi:hypothetical protein
MDNSFFQRFGSPEDIQVSAVPSAPQADAPAQAPAPVAGADDAFMNRFGAASQDESGAPLEPAGAPPSVEISPVSFSDRLKINLGNQSGSLKYLKSKFEDAAYDPDNGLLVKHQGKWMQVDPSGWGDGDAWDKTKELAGDIVDLADEGINAVYTGLGALGGTFVGGPLGSVAGAAAGGAASAKVRTSFGRLAGTYDATPTEEVKDILVESALSAGGQTLALGAKPTIGWFADGIKKFATNAAPAVRATVAKMVAATADVAPQNAERVFERSNEVMSKLKQFNAKPFEMVAHAMNQTKVLFADANKALSGEFARNEQALLAIAPDSFQFNAGQTIQGIMGTLQQSGAIVPKSVSSQTGKVLSYKIGDEKRLLEMLQHGESGQNLKYEALKGFQEFLALANQTMGRGTLKGKEGLATLMNIRRGFDKFYYQAIKANPDMVQTLTPMSSQVRTALVAPIHAASPEVASKYAAMNAAYVEKLPFIAEAGRIIKTPKSLETFVGKLTKSPEDSVAARQTLNIVKQLKGANGAKVADNILDTVAAQDFIKIMPSLPFKKVLATAGVGAVAHSTGFGPLAAATMVAAAPLTSPRFVGNVAKVVGPTLNAADKASQAALPYARMFGDFVKSLTPEQAKAFIGNPALFQAAIRETVMAPQFVQEGTKSLLNQALGDQQ